MIRLLRKNFLLSDVFIVNYIKQPNESCVDAARRVLDGEKTVDGCLYFVNPVTTTSDWVMKNREFAAMIGNHAFYK